MSDEQDPVHNATDGGVCGAHTPPEPPRILAAPATASEFNRVKLRLIPVACRRVDDIRFDFGSSFVRPGIATEMQQLQELREKHKTTDPFTKETRFPPLSIFGHADPTGSNDLNKDLSGRRATAIFALRIRDTGLWEGLGNQPSTFGIDRWGSGALQTMETETGLPHGTAFATCSNPLRPQD